MEWEQIVGANIRRLRKERGLSQEALAGEAGLAMRHLGRIERGEGNPTVAILGKLAEVLGVLPTDFYAVGQ
ncbi:helix-turn-helix transcriptional regulator [Brevundimonas sp. 3P9-tot-E]|jgi:transcriptional regulator with XRE-family HTH domain|uniref:helix-turn-helix domain-containing protein n=1 Tax=Brevundimonas TaxID=41275 RepID=UPI000E936C12|nr:MULTISPECIES: helix-turn-helix transcriptional regulator [Brevundimonas]MDA0744254.1 helix-turn-helix transcriptional regulator [Pseudomonadota bacterium]MBK1970633.1 helix-turn-helix transcriptional regulator [Brevundimonas diminuta]MBK1976877.1 helix-turn-helix transcriptional regulator [Brevundimonas diminuta]MDA1320878.1 helix-turn-helix transcriptional regulator [Pseudomonadota bacterium]MDM8354312.1 helix-turn-helix transcriptional regulator [Brevundimonas diminuta]